MYSPLAGSCRGPGDTREMSTSCTQARESSSDNISAVATEDRRMLQWLQRVVTVMYLASHKTSEDSDEV